jgi:glycosyltransferase involved in cell wall biosynthesis
VNLPNSTPVDLPVLGTPHDQTFAPTSNVGVVVIGRNEGQRLVRCLESVRGQASCVIYVDSGSTDGSVSTAGSLADAVVELDMGRPFTAARARNEGFERLLKTRNGLRYVFFVDGDCEVVEGWLATAVKFLTGHPDFAVVWGLRRERFPEKSIYNLICDIEWQDYPLGETRACGGDAVARVDAILQVEGYRADLICGEEPEMCIRLCQAGWRIFHLESPMTLHDAAIYRFSQWWKRMMRGGYGFAQGAALHGAPPERYAIVETRRVWFWGLGIPLMTLCLVPLIGWWAVIALAAYPAQVVRLAAHGGRASARENWLRAAALVLGKFPEMVGQVRFQLDRLRRAQSGLIEYK